MKTSALLVGLAATAATAILEPGMPLHLVSNPSPSDADAARIPTSYESAVMGRRILARTKLAELSTVFPAGARSASGGDLSGMPIGLMDYVADCEGGGNPTILAITIATSFKNVRAGSNISLSMHWIPPYPPAKRISLFSSLRNKLFGSSGAAAAASPDTVPYSAANLPRFSLLGYLEKIPVDPVTSLKLAHCFVDKHPDAKYWLPGSPVHESEWVRFVVTSVYWIGGFGDRAYIGWIPLDEWQNVTREEYESIELPGEKRGWEEWSADSWFDGADL
ncbi:pyridoxamine 5'-phosphate oxidase-domain-containing protein [Colletotrichum navitas]|uniref:Pyridoxamine 5'-phosphate oxidase-domain-containing protein n=1 Tax=Colletotrichum navitas TaxID=681940 RepID=A0AAD8Q6I5_9PEZI|nr:pyridoxamine 5'-phosphate oxidase-domain-containing protein [Colletotrichum navitas]KAK1596828.1 pyridoxamine 5'-phosphate oxidase-domain-containing protein [Colletotrichum navitas]